MTQQPWGGPPAQPAPQGYPAQQQYAPAPPAQQPPAQQAPWPGTAPGQQQYPPQQPQAPAQPGVAPVTGDSFDDFFSGGVKGEPGFDWGATHNAGKPLLGAQIVGTIVEMVQGQQTDFATRQPLFFPDGAPRMQVAVTLQTDLRNWEGIKPDQVPDDPQTGAKKHPQLDTGLRRIFVKSDMKRAVTEACLKAGQKPRKGGKLAVRVTGFEDTGKGNPMTKYEAVYQPAPEDGGTGQFFGQAPAPAQAQPVAPDTAPVVYQQPVPAAPDAAQQAYQAQVAAAQQPPVQAPPPDFAQAPAAPPAQTFETPNF